MCLRGDSEHKWKGGSMGAGSWERHLRQLGFCVAAESQHTTALFLASPSQGQGHRRSGNPDPTLSSKRRSKWEHSMELSTQNLGDLGFDPLNWWVIIAFLSCPFSKSC